MLVYFKMLVVQSLISKEYYGHAVTSFPDHNGHDPADLRSSDGSYLKFYMENYQPSQAQSLKLASG